MEPGSKWNEWTVEKYIGGGSSGKVYKIVKEEFGYKYESALKVIRIPQNSAQIEAARNEGMSEEEMHSYFYSVVQSITSEFALLSQLSGNSNIVSYEDHSVSELAGGTGWDIFLRMELVTPLHDYLKGRTMSAEEVIRMGTDICRALESCQKNNIIHRDIKPDNIFYSKQGTFKLGDFGIARKLEKMDVGMTKVGTVPYMAPEIYRGQNYDSSVDIYSLGIILYQFFNNNRRPFMPDYRKPIEFSDNESADIRRMTGEEMPSPAAAGELLTEVIKKACAFDTEDRYKDALQMRKDLEKVLQGSDRDELRKVVFPFEDASPEDIEDADYNNETVTLFSGESPDVSRIKRKNGEDAPSGRGGASSDDHDPEADAALSEEHNVAGAAVRRNETTETGINSKRLRKGLAAVFAAVLLAACTGTFMYFNHTVPDVRGMSSRQAEDEIRSAGLQMKEGEPEFSDTVERGDVISQDITAGEKVKRNSTVTVTVSKGKAVNAPDLTGKELAKAKKEANRLGFDLSADAALSEYSDDVPEDHVIRQDVESGTECEEGTVIKVILSKGIEQVKVPDVTSKTQAEAEKALGKAGFKTAAVTQYSNTAVKGTVISQDPSAGVKSDKNSKVTIYVSAGRQPAVSSGKTTAKKTAKKPALKHAKGKKL